MPAEDAAGQQQDLREIAIADPQARSRRVSFCSDVSDAYTYKRSYCKYTTIFSYRFYGFVFQNLS